MVDSATRMSSLTRVPIQQTLVVSHARSREEVDELLQRGGSLEGADQYEALVMRRLTFHETTCDILRKSLQNRYNKGRPWKKVELRNVEPSTATNAIATCMSVDAIEEIQFVMNNVEVNPKGWNSIGEGIRSNVKLRCLRITSVLEGAGIKMLSRGLEGGSFLKILDLTWCTFASDDVILTLARGLRTNTNLAELHCMGCNMRDDQLAWLVGGLANHPTLECLDINGNKAGAMASAAIARLLESNLPSLRKLDMSFQKGTQRLQMPVLSRALVASASISILDLSNCRLEDDDAILLGQMLCQSSSTILELFIARNRITDEGIISLAAMLPHFTSLRRLSLWGNPFFDEGARALADGMAENYQILDLGLFRHFSSSDSIMMSTQLNRAGRRLLHVQDPVPLGLWALVFARINKLSFAPVSTPDIMRHMLEDFMLCTKR
mmetsp:Transcript_78861/g.229035  ORF Transcript_78861/g.229035 Transcript_78861/m.229035 type:complete len:437 (+) Transcript_78861:205-1515(+)